MSDLSLIFVILCIFGPALILILGASIMFFEMESDHDEVRVKQREENTQNAINIWGSGGSLVTF